ncbi:putative quinol monooxygenase [Chloroflexota bacterium]
MITSVTSISIKREQVDEAIKVYREELIPVRQAGKGSPGNGSCGGYLLVDRDTGKGIAITFWPSAEDLDASEKSHYYVEPLRKFKGYLASPHVDLGRYEVCTQG